MIVLKLVGEVRLQSSELVSNLRGDEHLQREKRLRHLFTCCNIARDTGKKNSARSIHLLETVWRPWKFQCRNRLHFLLGSSAWTLIDAHKKDW